MREPSVTRSMIATGLASLVWLLGCANGVPNEDVGVLGSALTKSDPGEDKKVEVCHAGQTLSVGQPAISAHLRHADTLGPCPSPCSPTECDDGDLCTSDSCDAHGGCVHSVVSCDDGSPCTADSCNPETGCVAASADNLPCSDGNDCTSADSCVGGACRGTAISGCCRAEADCDDDDPCTQDVCVAGRCTNERLDCALAERCRAGFCNPDTGACATTPVSCEDSNPCTIDSCDSAAGCVSTAAPDGTPCEATSCSGSSCPAHSCQSGVCSPVDAGPGCGTGVCIYGSECCSGRCDFWATGNCCSYTDCTVVPCCTATDFGDATGLFCIDGACQHCRELGATCSSDNDCCARSNLYCDLTTNHCASHLGNGVKDGDEPDVDCGGRFAPPCDDGQACYSDSDCASSVCNPDHACGCVPASDYCGRDADCCGRICTGNSCGCAAVGQSCTAFDGRRDDSRCCNPTDYCDRSGNCAACHAIGSPCNFSEECCNGSCQLVQTQGGLFKMCW